MATVYGVNKTKVRTGPTPDNICDPGELAGKVRVMTDTYEAAGVVAASTIHMGDTLPNGARILDVIITFDALGSATVEVGDSTDTDRYIDATSTASAGTVSMVEDDNVDGLLYEIGTNSGDGDIIITTASAAITGTIRLVVFYTYE